MGLLQSLYINSSTFVQATAVFTDQALTTLAPDGFYSFGGYVREQVGGVLQQTALCEACNPNCGDELVYVVNEQGEYEYEVYLGDSIGAVRIEVNTIGGAAGFNVEYNGTIHNTIDTRNLGVLETSSSTGVTYIGDSSSFSTSGVSVSKYTYGNGDWIEGTSLSLNPFAGGNLTNSSYHGGGVIVFSKVNAAVNTAKVKIRAPFTGSVSSVQVHCVTTLPAFNSSQAPESSSTDGCDATASGLYYVSVVNGTVNEEGLATVALNDRVFNDPFAITPVTDGWFKIDQGSMEVTSGVITDISDCAE